VEGVLLLAFSSEAFSSEAFVSKVLPSTPWFSALKALVSVLVCIRLTGASFEMLERPEIKAWAVRCSDEVFSDEFPEMERQAMDIASWGENVNVKIPIINTQGHSSLKLIRTLLNEKMKLNVTALFTQNQLDELRNILKPEDDVLVSIFAGRIADTGVDPLPLVKKAVQDFQPLHGSKILWASTREVFNVYQANEAQCHIITCPDGIIQQLKLYGKSLSEYSLETVKGFYQDIQTAGLKLMTHSEFMD